MLSTFFQFIATSTSHIYTPRKILTSPWKKKNCSGKTVVFYLLPFLEAQFTKRGFPEGRYIIGIHPSQLPVEMPRCYLSPRSNRHWSRFSRNRTNFWRTWMEYQKDPFISSQIPSLKSYGFQTGANEILRESYPTGYQRVFKRVSPQLEDHFG